MDNDKELSNLLKATASAISSESAAAQVTFAAALEGPLRKGILDQNNHAGIFTDDTLEPGATPKYPLDFVKPGEEDQFVAYTMPKQGKIPERHVEGDDIYVHTYEVANSIDWNLSYARDGRFDVVARAMKVFVDGFVRKNNTDAWRTILAAAQSRGLVVANGVASPFTGATTLPSTTAGQFTKELVSRMKTTMTRGAGGNGNAGVLTDLYLSPEAMEDIRAWKVDDVDEITRREILMAKDGMISTLYGVRLHPITELGEGQEYDVFLTSTLSQAHQNSLKEFVVGLDLSTNDSFVHPIRQALRVEMDTGVDMTRRRKAGIFGWMEHGYGVLDNRRVLLGEF